MKRNYTSLVYTLGLSTLFICCLSMSSCKKNSDETVQEKTLKMLTGTWHINTVTADGIDNSSLYTGLALTFASGAYTVVTSGQSPVWPASGTWSFTDNSATSFTRDDNVIVSITSLTNTNLTLTLQWAKTTYGGGRESSIAGVNIFQFSK